MGRKPGRPQAGQEGLTRERILSTALKMVDEHGVEALSMRRLAAELGVDPMAIYHHLPNKQAVISGAIEMVFGEMKLPPTKGLSWQDKIRVVARAYSQLVRAHPNLVIYMTASMEVIANNVMSAYGTLLDDNEILFSALTEAGLPPKLVVQANDLIADYLNGFALGERTGVLGQPGERREIFETLDRQPSEKFPAMRAVFNQLSRDDVFSDMEVGIDFIIAGVEAVAKRLKS
jgi:TetR/AcrR family transcriptional regulator, tetracycline repressor protein